MALDVYFRDEADAELNNIYDYIASQGRPDTAIAYVRRIRDACMALAQFPSEATGATILCPAFVPSDSSDVRRSSFGSWKTEWKSSASLTAAVISKAG